MTSLNNLIWAIGLILQCSLLGVLVKRNLVRRLPLFALLIGIYVLRSVFLFTAFGHLSDAKYTLISNTLSLVDVALQVLVAWELISGGWRDVRNIVAESKPGSGTFLRRAATFLPMLAVSALVAWAISQAVPANPRSPVDRGVLLPGMLMLLVATVTAFRHWRSRASIWIRVLAGFAVLGVAGMLSQIGRTLAVFHRDAQLYARWSYTEAFAYIAVLAWWLVTVRDDRQPISSRNMALKQNVSADYSQSKRKNLQGRGQSAIE